jgi:hypothetical protein
MKRHAALIKPSEFNWSEAKLSCYGRDSCAGIDVVARYEHGLPLPFQERIRSKLCRRQMIEGFYEGCSDKCLGHDFRREETSQLLRSNMKGIRKVDNDPAVPLLEPRFAFSGMHNAGSALCAIPKSLGPRAGAFITALPV